MTRGRLVLFTALPMVGCLAVSSEGEDPRSRGGDLCPDPGTVTLHRLNRLEYDNTVRDLLGDVTHPAADFPVDEFGYGFDNIADVLATSPFLVEKYEIVAEDLASAAVGVAGGESRGPRWQRFEAESSTVANGGRYRDWGWLLLTEGAIQETLHTREAGPYELSARAFGEQAGPEPVRMAFVLDGETVATFDVTVGEGAPAIYRARAWLSEGTHNLEVAYLNDYYAPDAVDPRQRDRNLILDWIEVGGPFEAGARAAPKARARVMVCDPGELGREPCARQIFSQLGRRAWRRPLTEDELDRLVALGGEAWRVGDTFDVGVGLGIQALLLSPHFLFRVELDPDPADATPHALGAYELATRLSYFLWSSTPDDRLLQLAEEGRLTDPEVLVAEAKRMLADPKARALVEGFGSEWLDVRGLADTSPDFALFPSWDPELEASMAGETRAFFEAFLREDRSALDMLDADFGFLDERLAEHYGQPPLVGPELRRVKLVGEQRGGLLTQGTFLTTTSHARRTSPVKRGKWVLERLLCRPPPDPPPGVAAFDEQVNPIASVRQRTEQHRSNPACSSCHAEMDPIGFGLENFDPVGAWRTSDAGFAVDATGVLPGGEAFDGPRALSRIIKSHPSLPGCITEKLFTYALGRGPDGADACELERLTSKFSASGHRLSELIVELTTSPAFRDRRSAPSPVADPGALP